MAKIQFKRIMFRNFMSYGANNNTFEFMDGVTWCCGSNGFGKSTIVEAINFALFGDSYRGTN
jgi:DNA repair exonuclease SbcCD ATPase subunit